MAKYLDHHGAVNLPPDVAKQLVADAKARKKDQFGVVHLNAFLGKSDAWCLSEAPSADVVHKAHEAMGIRLDKGQIYEVNILV